MQNNSKISIQKYFFHGLLSIKLFNEMVGYEDGQNT